MTDKEWKLSQDEVEWGESQVEKSVYVFSYSFKRVKTKKI